MKVMVQVAEIGHKCRQREVKRAPDFFADRHGYCVLDEVTPETGPVTTTTPMTIPLTPSNRYKRAPSRRSRAI